jgi:hypothetical protein
MVLQANDTIEQANRCNLTNALHTALLLQPPDRPFTRLDLHMTVAGLSYLGDVRMRVAENPYKVRNLVLPHAEAFEHWYQEPFEQLENTGMIRCISATDQQQNKQYQVRIAQ